MALNSVLCWSGGKDSTASIILAHENGIQIDKIIMSEVMFSHKDNISGEDSEHIEWVYNYAIPLFKSWGYDIEVLRDKEDYLSMFNRKYQKSIKYPENNGKKWGFALGGRCYCNNYLKIKPINNFKTINCNKDAIIYQGIAVDEQDRLQKMKERKGNNLSILEQFNYTELMAFELCEKYNLLSPLYLRKCNRRQGCWFCPNRSIGQFAELYVNEPNKWEMLVELSKTPNLCSYGFKYRLTVQEVEKKILLELKRQEALKNQISIFDEPEPTEKWEQAKFI